MCHNASLFRFLHATRNKRRLASMSECVPRLNSQLHLNTQFDLCCPFAVTQKTTPRCHLIRQQSFVVLCPLSYDFIFHWTISPSSEPENVLNLEIRKVRNNFSNSVLCSESMKATTLHDVAKPCFREQKIITLTPYWLLTMIRPMNGVAGYR